jgi:chaperonin GroES
MLQPLHDYVLLKKEKEENEEKKTASGIILSTTSKEKSKLAVVASIGKDVEDAGYACGDKVLYKEYSGTNMKIDDEEYIVIKDEDIIAVSK